jgi:hypothetical protein
MADNWQLITVYGLYGPVSRMPPSTGNIAAVTIDASSDAKYNAA